ncbi:DUF2158 domain-containing protein [Hymenobacter sp.]|uniref:DUF2158 domain-containing protein n=1 Tax=Hymenobacter sp. TaxID=1898978 RepID=UPI00286A9D83|nr:DUF2158 domain-containing protein [Hymenobacter sp.]
MADSTTFQPGDVVQLKSGGALMTVYQVYNSGASVKCYYSTAESPAKEANGIAAVALQKVDPAKRKPSGGTAVL